MGWRRKGISVAARKINRICWGKICSNKEFGGLGMQKIIESIIWKCYERGVGGYTLIKLAAKYGDEGGSIRWGSANVSS